jgi:hypothetical protein
MLKIGSDTDGKEKMHDSSVQSEEDVEQNEN